MAEQLSFSRPLLNIGALGLRIFSTKSAINTWPIKLCILFFFGNERNVTTYLGKLIVQNLDIKIHRKNRYSYFRDPPNMYSICIYTYVCKRIALFNIK